MEPNIGQRLKNAVVTFNTTELKLLLGSHLRDIVECNWFNPDGLNSDGGPLHWAITSNYKTTEFAIREMFNVLLEAGCPQRQDIYGFTPLHKAVQHGSLAVVVTLLGHLGDPNEQSHRFKQTPLHLAAMSTNPESLIILKVLAVFNADLDAVDSNGNSGLHLLGENSAPWASEGVAVLHALKAKRCPEFHTALCTRACAYQEDKYLDEHQHHCGSDKVKMLQCQKDQESPKYHLLTLDGGGVRGVVLTQMLLCIEKALNKTVHEYFNCIAGTSTGGILALGLASKKSVLECQGMYFQLKDKVFKGAKSYKILPLEEFLKQKFGGTSTFRSLVDMRVMVTTTNVSTIPPELHLFRNYEPLMETNINCYNETYQDRLIWKAALLTGAAPFYFEMEHHALIDGGFVSNNPTLDALAELSRLRRQLKLKGELIKKEDNLIPSVIVSLGTSMCVSNPGAQGVAVDSNVWKCYTDPIGFISKLPGFAKLLLEQATASNGPIVDRCLEWASLIGSNFIRLNPHISTPVELDETDDYKLINLMYETRIYMLSLPFDLKTILL